MELANENFHDFSLFGIGKPSEKQRQRQEAKALKKDPMFELTGCMKPRKIRLVGAVLSGGGAQQIAIVKKYNDDMKKYKKCLADYKERTIASGNASELAKIKVAEEDVARQEAEDLKTSSAETAVAPSSKFLGMPKPVGITVAVVGGLAILVGGFLLIRKFKK